MSFGWMFGAFVVVLTPIILAHELGHFVAARLSGIKVEEFGLGFPPRAAKLFEWKGTIFSLNWIPIGGFVRPAGEDDPNVPGGLASASKKARFFVLIAGAAANFLMALAVYWLTYAVIGLPHYDESIIVVAEVVAESPASEAGLAEGDRLRQADGQVIDNVDDLYAAIDNSNGEPITFAVERGEDMITVVVTPRMMELTGGVRMGVGLRPGYAATGGRDRANPITAIGLAAQEIWNVIYTTMRTPFMLIRGEVSYSDARLVGPVGISQIAGSTAQTTVETGEWSPFLRLVGLINVALGFTNLLPIPALDGGRLLFVIVEAIRGRRIEPEREGLVHMVGMMILLALVVLIFIQDIVNPIIPY